jgi:hypothetical protein
LLLVGSTHHQNPFSILFHHLYGGLFKGQSQLFYHIVVGANHYDVFPLKVL